MTQSIKVAHVWGEFHPGLFANPHDYLLSKPGWDSVTFASKLVQKNNSVPKQLYAYSTKTLEETNQQSFFQKATNKLRGSFYWSAYNNWILQQPSFKETQIIHAHFGQMGVRLLPLLKKTRLPLVVSFYGVDGSQLLLEKKWTDGYKKMFRCTKAAIVLCEEVKIRLQNIGLPENHAKLWRIPIELDTYQYEPREKKDEVRFIIAARFVEKKGYPYVLEAFGRMVKEGKNVKLAMVGYGPGRTQIEEEIKQRGLQNHAQVFDTKVQGNFPEFYYGKLKQSDIFILPSTTSKDGDDEGGPALTLVAAQASGLPVICTPFPGAEMSVIENETGLFCKFNNSDSLYEKMNYLYSNPQEWNRLGAAASKFAHNAFATIPQMEEILSIYKEVLQ